MKKLLWIVLSIFVAQSANFAQATFLPEDQIKYGELKSGLSNTTEEEFRAIINQIQKSYEAVVSHHGGKLSITGDWKSEKLNAAASQMGNAWRVVITGALARRPELTQDGFSLILCHELGHHLAGYSFAQGGNPMQKPWAANEGQSDYFATQVCARKLWGADKEKNATFRGQVPDYVKVRCDTAWPNIEEQDLCYRINTGVNSMVLTMATLKKVPPPQFETPDPKAVDKTNSAHPAVQCRMDTSFQGSLCAMPFEETIIPGKKVAGGPFSADAEREAFLYSCRANSQPFGFRPACWFKQAF